MTELERKKKQYWARLFDICDGDKKKAFAINDKICKRLKLFTFSDVDDSTIDKALRLLNDVKGNKLLSQKKHE